MADAKWSDNTQFPVASSLPQYIMGLTSSPGNTKVPSSLFASSSTSITPTFIYVDSISGHDAISTTGSILNPFATISYAQANISDATPSKPYVIYLTTNITDAGQIYAKPNINIVSANPSIRLINSLSIIAHPSWASSAAGSQSVFSIGFIDGGINIDLSPYGAGTIKFINMDTSASDQSVQINGFDSGDVSTSNFYFFNFIASINCSNLNLYTNNCTLTDVQFGTASITQTTGMQWTSVNDYIPFGCEFRATSATSTNNAILNMSNANIPEDGGNLYITSLATNNVNATIFSSVIGVLFPQNAGSGGIINITCTGGTKIAIANNNNSTSTNCLFNFDNTSYPSSFSSPNDTNVTSLDINYLDLTEFPESPIPCIIGLNHITDVDSPEFLLPLFATVGQKFWVTLGTEGNSFSVNNNDGQTIVFYDQISVTGTSGYIESSISSGICYLEFTCLVDNTIFAVTDAIGSFTLNTNSGIVVCGNVSLSSNNVYSGDQSFHGQLFRSTTPVAYATSSTLAAADIISGIIIIPSTVGSPISLDWGSSNNLITAMVNPFVNATIDLLIVNTSAVTVSLTNTTDPTHVGTVGLIGGNSATILALTSRRVSIVVSNLTINSIAIFG